VTLLAVAADRRAAVRRAAWAPGAVVRYLLLAGLTAANPSTDGTDGRTDRQTDTLPLHRPVAY